MDGTERTVELTRAEKGVYDAVNVRGGRLRLSTGDDEYFSPVELLLVAIAGCSAADVDFITAKRAEPDSFTVAARADKVRGEAGNHLTGIRVTFDVVFPDDEGGQAAREVLPEAARRSHDRLCTVSRTVEIGTPVEVVVPEG
jgi:putative redox protein